MKKILVIQTRPGIGDMCVFLPCIHEIGKVYNQYELHVLTKKRTCSKDFLNNDKYIDKIIYLPNHKNLKLNFSILNFLRKERYDQCFIMHYGFRYPLLCYLSGVKKIFYYSFFKKRESIIKRSRLSVSKWLNKKDCKFKPRIFLNKNYEKKDQITIGIGGSGENKKWSIDNYIKLLKLILKNNNISQIVIAGGKNESDDAERIINHVNFKNLNYINLCNKTIAESISYLIESKFFIGNDTGFMHLSACFNVISYGIFGDTPSDYSSYNENLVPIMPENLSKVDYNFNMMNSITSDYVYKFLKENNDVV